MLLMQKNLLFVSGSTSEKPSPFKSGVEGQQRKSADFDKQE